MPRSRRVERQAAERVEIIRSSIQRLLPANEYLVVGHALSLPYVVIQPRNPIQQEQGVRLTSGARLQMWERYVWDGDQLELVDYRYAILFAPDPDAWVVRYELHSFEEGAPEWARRPHLHANFGVNPPSAVALGDLHLPSLLDVRAREPGYLQDILSSENKRKRAVVLELFSWLDEEIGRLFPRTP